MRTRLVVVFLVPLLAVIVLLGGAYGVSASRGVQQEFFAANTGDLGYFAASARQALVSGSSQVLEGEIRRYEELYGARIAVVDRTGIPREFNGVAPALDEDTLARVSLALSGRRSEVPEPQLPWPAAEFTDVEPVFSGGDVVGAVVLTQSLAGPREKVAAQWAVLGVLGVLGIGVGTVIVMALARWVLRPVQRLDEAMEAIERGDMEARIDDSTGPPELQRMIQIFNNMATEIERVLARQQEFALNASHELRNPLNALLMHVEMLATGLPEAWEADVEATREEGRRLVRILDTLLELSKGGKGDPTARTVDVSELVRQRAVAWKEVAAKTQVRLRVREESGIVCATDQIVVESALDAVLDNAIKYAPHDTRVDLHALRSDEGVRIVVRDQGPGVEPAELAQLTNRFWRSAGAASVAGSGLGLAIATDLMRSIDGELQLQSAPGEGLEVTLWVRRATSV